MKREGGSRGAVRQGPRRYPACPRHAPISVGYVGGCYQWDNNWKFTGRFGVQHSRRRAASEPDAVSRLHAADLAARPRPHG